MNRQSCAADLFEGTEFSSFLSLETEEKKEQELTNL